SVNAAAFFAGMRAKSPHEIVTKPRLTSPWGKLSEPSSGARACVATKACGVIQIALPTMTIRNATLTIVREDTVHGMSLPISSQPAMYPTGIISAILSGIGHAVQ